jgi:Flp pilus assembly protein TadG
MKVRNSKGSMAILAFIGLMPLLAAIGAFGVDMMHVNSTQGELQKACDAGALAGANQLWQYDTDNGASALQTAATVTALNPADGKLVADGDPQITVNTSIAQAPVNGIGGRVRVDADMQIRGIFSHIFGVNFQRVAATSQAGPLGAVTTAFTGSLFPLAVSLTVAAPDGTFLKDKNLGDSWTLRWDTQNAYFCGLDDVPSASNANNVRDLMDAFRNPTANNGHPAISVGDNVDVTAGTQATNIQKIADDFNGKTLVLPLIEASGNTNGNVRLVGWVGFKVTNVVVNGNNSTITGTIANSMIYGTGGPPPADPTYQTFISKYQISPARLLE